MGLEAISKSIRENDVPANSAGQRLNSRAHVEGSFGAEMPGKHAAFRTRRLSGRSIKDSDENEQEEPAGEH